MARSISTLFTVTALVVLGAGAGCLAAGIQKGAAMHVKPNSIWFQDAATLTRWQALKKGGDAAALVSFENDLLWNRTASQFTNELAVKVLGFEPRTNQVKVEMNIEGSMRGSTWVLDAGALER